MLPEHFFLLWMPRLFVWKKKIKFLLLVFLASYQLFSLSWQECEVGNIPASSAGWGRHLQQDPAPRPPPNPGS